MITAAHVGVGIKGLEGYQVFFINTQRNLITLQKYRQQERVILRLVNLNY